MKKEKYYQYGKRINKVPSHLIKWEDGRGIDAEWTYDPTGSFNWIGNVWNAELGIVKFFYNKKIKEFQKITIERNNVVNTIVKKIEMEAIYNQLKTDVMVAFGGNR